ncbi:oligopeptidase A [Candidatus Palibaumannia cicadellinicola]|uniref:oligopeptidase A n=1 Tax=Baumannia cicadellinicola subsp. Homalodisca coagulata TaxID=374463 RepID=Q1LU32_BAUCH|nr:oligopeptidase A [Candidatus Baumannia cicadellinicola]ABF14182.1 oligopeptidase A [Baumannia cicadellinicola str. Hc (Homalodisca coagulata)]MBS0032592.1 oligopeptidase A [Candidatus Baumannia cicadellinicola]MCJ7462495.1 oligopeptidase A [Candidatus Baumannia cicadellinicola]
MKNYCFVPPLLPLFSVISSENIVPAVKEALDYCRNTIEQVTGNHSVAFNWENLCQRIADADNYLSHVWSPVNHLNAVNNNPEIRAAYEESITLLSAYSTWVGQHKDLYNAYCSLSDSDEYKMLSIAQKQALDNTLRSFKLSGINLITEKQQRYGQIIARLSNLESNYSNNVLDATMGWNKLITNKDLLSGIPDSGLAAARANAELHAQEGWLLTLDIPCYLLVITYCDNSILREELYRAYNTRASDQGPNAGKWDNGPIIQEILSLRNELANILGFNNYAEQSLVTKMARDPQEVLDFLHNLAKLAFAQGEQELAQLCKFAKTKFNHDKLEPWDIAYYSEKQKQSLFSINDEQLRPYFPESQVLSGLFEIVKRVYGIRIVERKNVDVWHLDVRFFDVFDELGELRGSFYLDLYIRDNKRSGAWMDECISMMRKADGTLQKPVAYLTCNFHRPVNGKPSLLTHNEVTTLFHEFGHGIHHMLTIIETPGVSGINGVPWDAVELPSQFMENFCWQPEALHLISGHYETKKPLPTAIINKLLKVKNYQAALGLLRQVELSLFDFYMHYLFHPSDGINVLEILAKVKKQVSVLPNVEWTRFPNTFSHVFSGGYAAGYYSYLWANVLAADAWSRLEEEGIFNQKTGKSFIDNILSRGGSEDPMVLFTRFRGRKPQLDAMLRHYGISNISNIDKDINSNKLS